MKYITNKLSSLFILLALFGLTACTNIPVDGEDPKNQKYVIQLTATTNAANAASIKKTFVNEGYTNTSINTITTNGKKIHRVQIGPYGKELDGNRVLAQMKTRYLKNQYVRSAVVKTIYGK